MNWKQKINEAVKTYISDEELYDDNAQLVINPADGSVFIEDGDVEIDDALDRYDVMDLLRMDGEGNWQPDQEAIAEVAAAYKAD